MSRLSQLIRQWKEGANAGGRRQLARFVLFDHVPKTGGTTINRALRRLFVRQVSADSHKLVAQGDLSFADRYPIISGHFGGKLRRELQRRHDRLTFTVLREPVARVVSSYSYWRHRIGPDDPDFGRPVVQAAKTLAFAPFIRSDDFELRRNLFNAQFTHLAGLEEGADFELVHPREYADRIAAVAREFDVLGTTERLAESLRWLLREIECERPGIDLMLERASANRSPKLDPSEISIADRRFILERSRLDQRLHEIARKRLWRATWVRRTAAARNAWVTFSRRAPAD